MLRGVLFPDRTDSLVVCLSEYLVLRNVLLYMMLVIKAEGFVSRRDQKTEKSPSF